ncbi:MAG: SOS response-associated peptidase family protein [Hyphomonadaceae bacterium]
MCNLYYLGHSRDEIAQFVATLGQEFLTTSETDNLAPGYIGADSDGPVLRATSAGLELASMRWGFPPTSPKNKAGKWAKPITNIRNLESRWWQDVNRQWLLEPEHCCLVPFSRFAEPVPGKGRENAWFDCKDAFACFAGIWRPWSGNTRLVAVDGKSRRQRAHGDHDLFAFLTTEPNALIGPIHPKAMPVILTEQDEILEWLSGGMESLSLQRPLEESEMRLLERG